MRPIARPFYARLQEVFWSSGSSLLAARRVQAAKSLLLHSDKSLLRVALEAGFTDQPAFNRSFREIIGTSPGQWRRANAPMPKAFKCLSGAEAIETALGVSKLSYSVGREPLPEPESRGTRFSACLPSEQDEKSKMRHFQSRQGCEILPKQW